MEYGPGKMLQKEPLGIGMVKPSSTKIPKIPKIPKKKKNKSKRFKIPPNSDNYFPNHGKLAMADYNRYDTN